ncbi:glycosyltransferase [Mycobacterium sp.]|uniref:glycosyltransferase n=1 Tax=Mycobacterium sp. TaxID=1785 RepID=UPI003C7533A7
MKFVVAGYGSRGDVEPCIVVARELLRRGHDVQMAVTVPPDLRAVVESAGLTAVRYGRGSQELLGDQDFVRMIQNPLNAISEAVEFVAQVSAEKNTTLTSLSDGADLLVAGITEQTLAANVAEYHSIPLVALHFFPPQILELRQPRGGPPKEAERAQRRVLGLPEASGPPAPSLEIQAYEELCFPGLAAEWGEQGGRRPFVGALTLELPTVVDDEVLAWIAAGTPPIYFGFGSMPLASPAETVAVIGAACGLLGERALICMGANDCTQIPHTDHVKVVEAVNHAVIFPACRAVVHHGGAGTTAAGLRAGVPSLVLWAGLDQPIWAAAIERLRVGSAQRFSAANQESLVADLRVILGTDCVTRAREVAALMTTSAESVASAADLIEATALSA